MLIQVNRWNNLECTLYSFEQGSTLTCSLLPRLRADQVWMLKPSLTNSAQKSLVAQTAKRLDSEAILAKLKMLQGTCSDCQWFMRRSTELQWPVRHSRGPAARVLGKSLQWTCGLMAMWLHLIQYWLPSMYMPLYQNDASTNLWHFPRQFWREIRQLVRCTTFSYYTGHISRSYRNKRYQLGM